MTRRPLVIASASVTRQRMLAHAGLEVIADPADIDEGRIKAASQVERLSADDTARRLAAAKADRVSRRHPAAIVIGADQILECDGQWFDKPPDIEAARGTLLTLRGRRHDLVTAVTVTRDGACQWHRVERARLAMRPFSDRFLDAYVGECGEDLTTTVGAYRMEGPGVQLFSSVEGSHFTILGLPLLPLLAHLRQIDAIPQ